MQSIAATVSIALEGTVDGEEDPAATRPSIRCRVQGQGASAIDGVVAPVEQGQPRRVDEAVPSDALDRCSADFDVAFRGDAFGSGIEDHPVGDDRAVHNENRSTIAEL